ncbi:hypothetical protein [Arthrobacter sp. GMC3]|uniref:hypothetical protein n=1 Tax=Arthrobacter sp. GMC3 TaxID=2058894 RepID=UPI0021585AC7|nr:hypothetical protein [Arthrobacter sp. GMC3]
MSSVVHADAIMDRIIHNTVWVETAPTTCTNTPLSLAPDEESSWGHALGTRTLLSLLLAAKRDGGTTPGIQRPGPRTSSITTQDGAGDAVARDNTSTDNDPVNSPF